VAPEEFVLPDLKALTDELPKLIKAVTSERLFADPPVTEVVYRKR